MILKKEMENFGDIIVIDSSGSENENDESEQNVQISNDRQRSAEFDDDSDDFYSTIICDHCGYHCSLEKKQTTIVESSRSATTSNFDENKNLENHDHHNDSQLNTPDFFCYMCDKKFKSKTILMEHLTSHGGNTSFICAICLKKFLTKSQLMFHQRVHERKTKTRRPY